MAKITINRIDNAADLRFRLSEEQADLLKPYKFEICGIPLEVSVCTDTDGSSIPRALLSIIGDRFSKLNLFPAIVHDACYSMNIQYAGSGIPVYFSPAEADELYRRLRAHIGGATAKNWFMWMGIRMNSTCTDSYPTLADFRRIHPEGVLFSDLVSSHN